MSHQLYQFELKIIISFLSMQPFYKVTNSSTQNTFLSMNALTMLHESYSHNLHFYTKALSHTEHSDSQSSSNSHLLKAQIWAHLASSKYLQTTSLSSNQHYRFFSGRVRCHATCTKCHWKLQCSPVVCIRDTES